VAGKPEGRAASLQNARLYGSKVLSLPLGVFFRGRFRLRLRRAEGLARCGFAGNLCAPKETFFWAEKLKIFAFFLMIIIIIIVNKKSHMI